MSLPHLDDWITAPCDTHRQLSPAFLPVAAHAWVKQDLYGAAPDEESGAHGMGGGLASQLCACQPRGFRDTSCPAWL